MANAKAFTVCHVVGGLTDHGGTWNFVCAMATTGANEGVSHVVWMHQDYQPKDAGLKCVCAGSLRRVNLNLRDDFLGAVREARALARWLRSRPGVLLHAHTRPGILAASWACRLSRRPLLIHIHALHRRQWFYKLLRRISGAVFVFNSPNTCAHFGHDPRTSRVVTPPVRWPTDCPEVGGGGPHFVAASAFYRSKNLHLVLAAFNHLKARHPAATLDIYGMTSGEAERPYVEFMKQQAGRSPGVRLMAYDRRWYDHLRQSDIFVHVAEVESFGIVVLEALARGCRLVLTPGTVVDDLPEPQRGEGVFRVDAVDAEGVAAAMERAVAYDCQPGSLWHSRMKLRESFSVEETRAKLDQIYRDVWNLRRALGVTRERNEIH